MSIVDVARDALKEIPLSEVLRERVSLALDRLADAEKKIESLQTENGGLKAQLERECIDHEKTKEELKRLQDLLREEIRIVHDVEFRRSPRTGGEWKPFCPKCHLPIELRPEQGFPFCNDSECVWTSNTPGHRIASTAQSLPK